MYVFLLLLPSVEMAAQMRILPREKVDSLVRAAGEPRFWSEPYLQFDSLCINVGKIPEHGDPVVVEFNLRNVGSEDITIGRLETSCSCLRAEIQPLPAASGSSSASTLVPAPASTLLLRAGSSAVVRAEYDPRNHPGRHPRFINIYLAPPLDTLVASLCLESFVY